jgi:hypothetical protein
MDGKGMSIFAKTWAKNVAAVSEGRFLQQGFKQESLDRTHAFGNGSSMQLSDFPNYRLTKENMRSDLTRVLLRIALAKDFSHPKWKLLEQLHLSYWIIPQASLQAIKLAAAPSTPNAPVLTDRAVLSAIIWRHITRARQLYLRGVEMTCLLNVVSIDRRLDPPLPVDYPGNSLAHAKTTATPLEVESEKPLYELARQVTDSIDWWTSERIWGLIGGIDSTPNVGKV